MRYIVRERLWAMGEDSDITDESGRAIMTVDGKVLSLHSTLILRNPSGDEIGRINRKLVALTPTYEVTLGNQEVAEVRKHFFTPFVDRFTIDLPGDNDLEMSGDLFEREFTIERDGQTVATVSKRWFSLTATYGVDVAAGEDDTLILASVLALDLALDSERNS